MSVALRIADRVAASGGPRAGLSAYRVLAEKTTDDDVKGRALLAALRCAVALDDREAIATLTSHWNDVATGLYAASIAALCKRLPLVQATALAYAEVKRHVTAHALYTYARCLDTAGDPRAAGAFAEAAERAAKEGAGAIVIASRVRRVAWLARSLATLADALEEASRLDLARLGERDRRAVARVLLCSPSRFVRAGALEVLDARSCARHVEDMDTRLTPLELDRVIAKLQGMPDAQAAARAIVRGPDPEDPRHARAREILAGRFEPNRDLVDDPWSLLLDVAAALRDGTHARAASALRLLAAREERGAWSPVHVWTIAEAALASESAEVRGVAGRLATSRMARGACVPPPRGWLALATALADAGMMEPADLARRAAFAAKEKGAADALVLDLTKAGWELARSGERARAISRLREAKALSSPRGGASNPSR